MNFQSFGPEPTTIDLSPMTYVLGPNGSGKTAVLQALSRLFSPVLSLRKIQLSDFHVPIGRTAIEVHADAPSLWIEADIEFPEAGDEGQHASIPVAFSQMKITSVDGIPMIRVRLTATIATDGVIEERIEYVHEVDDQDEPIRVSAMSRLDRANIEVHYLPARRDPVEHISYTATSLIGRMLRAVDWSAEKEAVSELSQQLTDSIGLNESVKIIGEQLASIWSGLHSGDFFTDPSLAFGSGDLDSVLKQLSIAFSPSHDGTLTPFERLSDGQKSLLYISLVLSWQSLTRKVLDQEVVTFDVHRMRPPVHTIIALEEPENSLAPQYLGRINRQLESAADDGNVQSVIATHAPSLLRRVDPGSIRFLRLNEGRRTKVRRITLPKDDEDVEKYVRQAVRAFPELYFARLVILGEGDSEQMVLPRVFEAAGSAEDDASIIVVPLGGRHVNHFWRLLDQLEIPHATLLDLDSGRHQGGWGRVKYAMDQLNALVPETFTQEEIANLPKWNDNGQFPYPPDDGTAAELNEVIAMLETHGVYFSHPVDLDLMMMRAFPDQYEVAVNGNPSEKTIVSVLGKGHHHEGMLGDKTLELFDSYHEKFKLGSKPAQHLEALSRIYDFNLYCDMPDVLSRLVNSVGQTIKGLPE